MKILHLLPKRVLFNFGDFVNSLEGTKDKFDRLQLGVLDDGYEARPLTIEEKVACYRYQLERVAFEAAGGKGLFVSSRDAENIKKSKGFRAFGEVLQIGDSQGVSKAREEVRKQVK